jgi:hypothetical protein
MESDAKFATGLESRAGDSVHGEGHSSGVSWGAVVGGAFATAAFSLILLALGAGMGLSSVSPWANVGASASTFGTAAIIWMVFVEIVASALGGYLTGRLRIKWAVIHSDEVFFRDTANGFLAWAVAVVMTVTFLASAAVSMVGAPSPAGSSVEAGARSPASDPNGYFIDSLLRSDKPTTDRDLSSQGETGRIFAHAMKQSEISATDRTYLAGLIAARTGISASDADKRVSDVLANARQVEDEARKVTARMLLWSFLSLLTGAFSASFAATIGGKQRDHVKFV